MAGNQRCGHPHYAAERAHRYRRVHQQLAGVIGGHRKGYGSNCSRRRKSFRGAKENEFAEPTMISSTKPDSPPNQ